MWMLFPCMQHVPRERGSPGESIACAWLYIFEELYIQALLRELQCQSQAKLVFCPNACGLLTQCWAGLPLPQVCSSGLELLT